jgi:hypothetical protein
MVWLCRYHLLQLNRRLDLAAPTTQDRHCGSVFEANPADCGLSTMQMIGQSLAEHLDWCCGGGPESALAKT